jgi:hypothetical protein
LVQWFADHQQISRATGVLEIALGSWIVARAYRDVE